MGQKMSPAKRQDKSNEEKDAEIWSDIIFTSEQEVFVKRSAGNRGENVKANKDKNRTAFINFPLLNAISSNERRLSFHSQNTTSTRNHQQEYKFYENSFPFGIVNEAFTFTLRRPPQPMFKADFQKIEPPMRR